jgi:hypothetical protein
MDTEAFRKPFGVNQLCPASRVFALLLFETIVFGLLDWVSAIGWIMIIPIMYATGLLVGQDFAPQRNQSPMHPVRSSILFAALSFILGGACFVFLTVSISYSAEHIFVEEYLKVIPGIWSGNPINRPGLGALASLGMCLLGMLLFWRDIAAMKAGRFLIVVLILVIGLSTYSNLILANRSPWLAMVAAFTVSWFLWIRIAPRTRLVRSVLLISLASLPISLFWTDVTAVARTSLRDHQIFG